MSTEADMLTFPAGYQNIETGWIERHDVLSGHNEVWLITMNDGTEASHLYGKPITGGLIRIEGRDYRVYRKMPVVKQGDSHERDALEKAAPQEVKDRRDYATAKAKTYDDGKPPLAYLPWAGVDAVAQVQMYGKKKYGEFYNYRKGMEVGRNISCAIRHLRAYMEGEDRDAESGHHHLAHAACRILFTLQNIHDSTHIDDRYQGSPSTHSQG